MLGSSASSSGGDVDLFFRIDWVRLVVAILSLKIAVSDVTKSVFGLVSEKKLGIRDVMALLPFGYLSDRLGFAPPLVSSPPPPSPDTISSNAELQAKNVTPC